MASLVFLVVALTILVSGASSDSDVPSVNVNLFTHCDLQLYPLHHGFLSGRYPRRIAAAFPLRNGQGVIFPHGPRKNLFCECITTVVMVCNIILDRDSEAWIIVRNKLRSSTPASLAPFFRHGDRVAFSIQDVEPAVLALINLQERPPGFQNPNLRGSEAIFHLPRSRFISKSLCRPCLEDNAPCCPITFNEFKENDLVYVLKGKGGTLDLGKVPPKPVYCISHDALERMNFVGLGRFVDPLRRRGNRQLGITHYELRIVTERDSSTRFSTDSPTKKPSQTENNDVQSREGDPLTIVGQSLEAFSFSEATSSAGDPTANDHIVAQQNSAPIDDMPSSGPRYRPSTSHRNLPPGSRPPVTLRYRPVSRVSARETLIKPSLLKWEVGKIQFIFIFFILFYIFIHQFFPMQRTQQFYTQIQPG